MALWLVRAGRSGEYEEKFLTDNKIYLTWDNFGENLDEVNDWGKLLNIVRDHYDDVKPGTVVNWASQIWAFSKDISIGHWVVLPSKFSAVLHFGEVTGVYKFDAQAEDPYYHSIDVNWFAKDVPRTSVDQDILYSMGAFLTICRIQRNDAEQRIKTLAANGWKPTENPVEEAKVEFATDTSNKPLNSEQLAEDAIVNLEELGFDQIAKYLENKFKGHAMERIIEGIFKAKGYTVYHSPKGADKGVDLLAAAGPYGFGDPRICIQVKTTATPVDRPTIDQFIGTMTNFNAEYGIFASWGGFKRSNEIPKHFFKVRFWGKNEIIRELLENYEKLDAELKSELGFKQVWTVSNTEEAIK